MRHAPRVTSDIDDRRPLVVTSEPALLDELLRLCGAAGSAPTVAADPDALGRAWSRASVVLLGAELAGAAADLPSRDRVVLVGTADDQLWELAADVGADHVAVLPSAAAWLVGLLSTPVPASRLVSSVVCVIGGQGGAGATTLAAALGRTASHSGTSTLLVDADPYGGGLDLALGLESASGDRWPQLLTGGDGASGVTVGFLDRLPMRGGLHLLATDRDEHVALTDIALNGVLIESRRLCGLTVIDLPRRLDAVTVAALTACERVFVVVQAQVRAVAAAAQLTSAVRRHATDVRAVVRGPAPSGLSLDAITRSLGIPLAGAVRAEPGLTRDYERGVPPGQPRGPLARLCTELLRQLGDDTGSARIAA